MDNFTKKSPAVILSPAVEKRVNEIADAFFDLTKKKIVITNATLAKSGGHITTSTAAPAPLPSATPKTDPLIEAQKKLNEGDTRGAETLRQRVMWMQEFKRLVNEIGASPEQAAETRVWA